MAAGFKDFASQTSAHGFGHLISAERKITKLLWVLLLLGFAGMLTYQIYSLVTNFNDADTKWVFSSYEKRKPVQMPNVTICNFNRLKKSKTAEFNMTNDLIGYFLAHSFNEEFPVVNFKYNGMREQFGKWLESLDMSWIDVVDRFSHQCEDTLVSVNNIVAFDGVPYSLRGKGLCYGGSDLRYVYSMQYGRCLQIEVTKGKTYFGSSINDKNNGDLMLEPKYTLVLDTQIDEYLEITDSNFLGAGFAIQIGYSGIVNKNNWITVGPGQLVDIGIQRHEIRVDRPKQSILPDCRVDTKLDAFDSSEYSPLYCAMDCLISSLQFHCLPFMMSSPKYNICATEVEQLFYAEDEEDMVKFYRFGNCTNQCLPACQSDQVDAVVSTTSFPPKAQSQTFKDVLISGRHEGVNNNTVISERFMVINLHFKNEYVKITERHPRTTFGELISNVGGQMGLWLGMSTLTLAHAITYAGHIALAFIQKCVANANQTKNIQNQ